MMDCSVKIRIVLHETYPGHNVCCERPWVSNNNFAPYPGYPMVGAKREEHRVRVSQEFIKQRRSVGDYIFFAFCQER